jgi:hypothetical protein
MTSRHRHATEAATARYGARQDGEGEMDLDWSFFVASTLCTLAFCGAVTMIFGADRSFYRFVWLIPASVAAVFFAKLQLGIDLVPLGIL